VIEREYLRFGLAGIFISRFLPGIRAVVPPVAGLVNLGAVRALVPIVLASGIWYGFVTWIGSTLGAEWGRIEALIGQMNRSFAIAGLVAAAVLAAWWWIHRRRRARRRLWQLLWDAFGLGETDADPEAAARRGSLRSAALLLLELAYLDDGFTPEERRAVEADLRERWQLGPAEDTGAPAGGGEETRGRITRYAARIRAQVRPPDRLDLVERMWAVALASPTLGERDQRLMSLAGRLLGFMPDEVAEARRHVRAELDREPAP
jgi:uncharacterized tellurite resistance protein B-like protein